jgi:protein-S-isoprenylcysteine O-methyltransferase Ste14
VDFIIDTLLRHISEKGEYDREARLIILSFFVHPVIIVLGFYENIYLIRPFLSFWNSDLIAITGLVIYVLMIALHLHARFIIGKFGTAALVIEDDHELITSGPYAFVRHPIYTAAIIGWVGVGMMLRSILVFILYGICYCWLWIHRANLEEKMLVEAFGEKYQEYMKKTKKIIPFIY